MKKTLIATIIAASVFLTACEDKSAQQEQKIAQLTEQLTQAQKQQAINAEREPIFVRKENVKYVDPETKQSAEYQIDFYVSTQKTQLEWLNNLLLEQITNFIEGDKKTIKNQAQLIERLDVNYQEGVKELQAGSFGKAFQLNINFLSQRQNIATFVRDYYAYDGGAHGMNGTEYIHVDLNTQKILTLSDLFNPQQLAKIQEILWQQYVGNEQQAGNTETFINKSEFFVSGNFYFSPNGIQFVYPLYSIQPFAAGEPELTLYWYSLLNEKLIDPKWVPIPNLDSSFY